MWRANMYVHNILLRTIQAMSEDAIFETWRPECRESESLEPLQNLPMESLPFTMEAYHGFGRVDGRIRAGDGTLVMEYQVKDDIFGWLKARPRQVKLSMADIEDVRFIRRRLRKSIFEIELSNLHLAERLPGSDAGRVKLRIERDFRDRAERIANRLQRYLSEHRLLSSDRELTDADLDMLFDDED